VSEQRCVLGYVLRKFPVLSETFVLNEILALEARGVEVHIFPLAPSRDPRFHEGVGRLKATMHHVPGLSDISTLLRHARRLADRKPERFRRRLLRALGSAKPERVWRFLQAAYVADRARRLRVTHLHAHFANHPAMVAHEAAKLSGIPFSFTAHAYDMYREADTAAIARTMADAKFTVTISEHNVEFLKSIARKPPPRIELVRNGVDMRKFAPNGGAPAGAFRMLTVSRLVEKKGLPVLIEACRLLRDRGLSFRCDIVGKGAQRALLEQLIKQWDLGRHVNLIGALAHQEVLERYHDAHAVVLPCIVAQDGNQDGLPVSIVEALACGVPVVTTPVSGVPEAVRHGENGLLVPPSDAKGLADALEHLIRDPELLAALRTNARASVLEQFDEQQTAHRLHDLFRGAPA
jgi:glycosyltransferase involved in cell wall biosynthesis